MNKREIVIKTIQRQRCDVIPHNIDFTPMAREKMARYLGKQSVNYVAEAVGNYCAQLNIGSVTGPTENVIEELYPKKIAPFLFRDDWGVIWKHEESNKDIGVAVDCPLKEPILEGFDAPDHFPRGKYLEKFCVENPDRFRLVSLSSPVFQRCWFLRGFENFLMDLILNKKFIFELIDLVMSYTIKVVEEALQYDIDALFFLDDFAQQQGLLLSPEMWRTYFKPPLQSLFDMVKDKGKFLFFHSCGNFEALIPDLIEMGVDVLNPMQPEVMDVYKIKQEYGGRVSFYGGIGTQELLPKGTVDEVKSDVREKILVMGNGGGYLLAPAHAIQIDVPPENVMALVEAMQNQ